MLRVKAGVSASGHGSGSVSIHMGYHRDKNGQRCHRPYLTKGIVRHGKYQERRDLPGVQPGAGSQLEQSGRGRTRLASMV